MVNQDAGGISLNQLESIKEALKMDIRNALKFFYEETGLRPELAVVNDKDAKGEWFPFISIKITL